MPAPPKLSLSFLSGITSAGSRVYLDISGIF